MLESIIASLREKKKNATTTTKKECIIHTQCTCGLTTGQTPFYLSLHKIEFASFFYPAIQIYSHVLTDAQFIPYYSQLISSLEYSEPKPAVPHAMRAARHRQMIWHRYHAETSVRLGNLTTWDSTIWLLKLNSSADCDVPHTPAHQHLFKPYAYAQVNFLSLTNETDTWAHHKLPPYRRYVAILREINRIKAYPLE